jgi:hypothetical protein
MLQDLNADSVKVHYACCVYLVLKAEADAGKPAVEGASIGTLLKGLDINVFLFFRIVTQMFQSAGRDAWFRNIFGGDCAKSEKDFRQLEAHFIILVILFAKYRKVSWTQLTAPSSPPHKGAHTWTDGRTDGHAHTHTHTHTHTQTHARTHTHQRKHARTQIHTSTHSLSRHPHLFTACCCLQPFFHIYDSQVYADVCSLTEGEIEAIVKGGGASMHRSLFTSCWKVNMISSTLFPHRHENPHCTRDATQFHCRKIRPIFCTIGCISKI